MKLYKLLPLTCAYDVNIISWDNVDTSDETAEPNKLYFGKYERIPNTLLQKEVSYIAPRNNYLNICLE